MRKHIVFILLLVCLVNVLSFTSCKKKEEAKTAEIPPVMVITKVPDVGNITDWFKATAELTSPLETPLSFPMGGKILELAVKEGDTVTSGQYLGKVDTASYEKQLDSATTGVDIASKQAEAAKLAASASKSQVNTAQANVDQMERDYNRMKKLHDEGVATTSEFEKVQLGYTAAKEGLQAAKDGSAAAEAQAKAAASGIQAAKDGVAQITKLIEDGSIRAPYSGRIASKMADIGTVAGPGVPVFILIADSEASSKLEVRYKIPESIVTKITLGMSASLSLLSLDKEVPLTVDMISPEIQSSGRAVDLISYIDASTLPILPGMFGTIKLPIETHEKVILLPEEAIVELADAKYVFVASGDKAVRHEVKTGIRSEGIVEIAEGIAAGDEVIVVGNRFLTDGARITRSEPTPTQPATTQGSTVQGTEGGIK
jgi:HlyD family secretion protein